MKISLLGQFGSGNSGNDGSLEAMLIYIRRMRPDAELLCICANPAAISARYNIPSMSVGGPPLASPWAKKLENMFGKLPRRLALLPTALAHFGGIDLMIIPGTGILDDFQEKTFGWPFVIFCWCLVARIRQTQIAFVSIGAGPIKGRLSRWFLRSAAKMASYRSYRDDYSLEYMRALGVDVSGDHRYPDIAFNLPPPVNGGQERQHGLTFGVGIMHYRGWHRNNPNSDRIYGNYIRKMSALVSWLIGEGHHVKLLMGDVTDQSACDDVMARLSDTIPEDARSKVEIGSGESLHKIMENISSIDLAIVSRYHNLVCSLKLGKPTISLGYARKNDDLMREFGQQKFCLNIETFEVETLTELVLQIVQERKTVGDHIHHAHERLQTQILEQQELLNKYLFPGTAHLGLETSAAWNI